MPQDIQLKGHPEATTTTTTKNTKTNTNKQRPHTCPKKNKRSGREKSKIIKKRREREAVKKVKEIVAKL